MKQQNSVWITLMCLGFAAAGSGFSQSETQPAEFHLKSVEWPGLGKTTAVCIEKDGLYVCVLPEGHQADDPQPRVFNQAGEEQAAKLIHQDLRRGICLLETETPIKNSSLPLSTHTSLEPGMALISLLPAARQKARLAGNDREYLGEELPTPMLRVRIESDGEFQPGSPVINEAGEIEGLIANRKLFSPNEAHAIPAGVIRKMMADVESHQKSAPVWVGMIFRANSSTPQVVEIKADSPASAAGFKTNDVVLEVNDRKISDLSDLVEALKLLPGETSAKFKVLRELSEIELAVIPKFVE